MVEYNKLTIEEYIEILNSVGWKVPSLRLLKLSVENGINVKYVLDGKTIGMARFVTDGGYAGFIFDVIVMLPYQGKGIGRKLIESLMTYVKDSLLDGEEMIIELLSAPGKQLFYEKFGFKVKKEVAEDGMYMWLKNM